MKSNGHIRTMSQMKWVIVISIAVMVVLVFGMFFYVKQSIHKERVVHLKNQTETTRNLLNKTIEEYSNYAYICSSIVSDQLEEGENVYDFLERAQNLLYMDDTNFILVDSNCNWYSNDNHNGRINEVEKYIKGTRRQEIYITQEVFSDKDCIVCRNILANPIQVQTDTGTASIEYCAVICYFDDLSSEFSVAFPYDCNQFVLNEQGGMLYKDFKMGILIGGSNVFSKYDRVNFLYGDKSERLLEDIKKGKTSVAEFEGSDGTYFICTARLRYNNWYTCFVIDSSELASGSYVTVVALFVFGMCLLFMLGIVVIAIMRARIRNAQNQIEMDIKEKGMLEQLAKSKSDFLSNMSHDIRTPINGIMGMTALARKESDKKKADEYLEKIERASDHLLSLVNDVLDMSSIESGKITLNKRVMNMKLVAEDCMDMLQGQAAERKLEMIGEFAELEHPLVYADELKIRQILLNLLSNAIKYTMPGGRVVFRLNEIEAVNGIASMKLVVEDSGIGMKAEFLEHIWESFAQEDGGSRTNYKGTGLGMAITKNLVDLMEGSIEVESELDKGSCFTVILPLKISEENTIDKAVLEEKKNIRGIKVLLVEDNEINLEIAEELLGDEGAELVIAHNGREAVDEFAGSDVGRFDIILMDVMMPIMNGYEASKAIRAMDREDADIPIIAMTANAYEDDIKASKAAGMNAHISKPLNIELLIKTIAKLCSE